MILNENRADVFLQTFYLIRSSQAKALYKSMTEGRGLLSCSSTLFPLSLFNFPISELYEKTKSRESIK